MSWNAAFLTAGIVQMFGLIPVSWFLIKHRELQHLQKTARAEKHPLTKQEQDRIKVIIAIGLISILFSIAACFGVMMLASSRLPLDARSASIPALYPVGAFFLMALGEMLLAPIGLSLVSKLSPPRLTAFFIGFWYLCVGLAFYIGGMLASFMDKFDHLYDFFGLFVILVLVPAAVLLFLINKLIKLSH